MPKLTSDEVPINPYRVYWDVMHTVDRMKTIVTHDSGSPRDSLVPIWESLVPGSFIGYGKDHMLGSGLGFIMGAKMANPDKFCINFMGDGAFGQVGMDFERRGYQMYARAAEETDSLEAKTVFNWLAREENKHYAILSKAYDYLESDGLWYFQEEERPIFEG